MKKSEEEVIATKRLGAVDPKQNPVNSIKAWRKIKGKSAKAEKETK